MFALNSCKIRLLLLPQITTTTTTTTTVTTTNSHLRLLHHQHHHHHHHDVKLHFPSLKAHFKSTLSSSSSSSSSPPQPSDSSSSLTTTTTTTVDFLMDSGGLSYEEAIQVIQQVPSILNNGGRTPRSVIAYFESIGFSKTHISKAISKRPRILVVDVEKTLKPKIQLFQDFGFSESDIADLIASKPTILRRSLNNQMKPALELIKSFVKTDRDLIKIIKRYGILPRSTYRRNFIEANIDVLRQHGVPDSEIVHLILSQLPALMSTPKVFKSIVKRIVILGFKPETRKFSTAVSVMSRMKKTTWDSKIDLLKGLGWSDEQILEAFRRLPGYLMLSGEKMKESIRFFKESLNWDASVLSQRPIILDLSLKMRVIPRLAVLKCLMSEEIIKEDKQFKYMLSFTETEFLSKFVFKYQEQLPYLYEVYENECMLGCNGEIPNQQDHDDVGINLGDLREGTISFD